MARLFPGGAGRIRATPEQRAASRAAAIKAMGPRGIVLRMAETMLDEVTRSGQATTATLISAGFSCADIARYQARALTELRRRAPDLRGPDLGDDESVANDVKPPRRKARR